MKNVNQYVMKDSGVQWIGQVPKHWEVCRVKDLFMLTTGGTPKDFDQLNDEEETIDWYTPIDIKEDANELFTSKRKLSLTLSQKNNIRIFPAHSLLFSGIGNVGKIGYLNNSGYANQQLTALMPKRGYSKYYYYFLAAFKDPIKDNAFYTVVPIVNNSYISAIPIALPPLAEQRAIADWLDAKCADIDAAIELQQIMIDKLKAYKTAFIHQAVTKVLDKYSNLKDSGVQWIGEIPKHWDVCQIKQVCRIFGRIGYRGYTQDDLVDTGEGAITLSPSNMQNGKMNFNKCNYLTWKKYYESPEIMINDGDILFVKTGSTYGKTSIVENLPMEATINPQIVVLKEIKMNNYFLYYLLLTEIVQGQVSCSVGGSTIPTLSQESISNYVIPLPPLSEQRAIADWLDAKCADIDATIALKEQKQEKLKAYKKTIIFEYVTGKKQVANINK